MNMKTITYRGGLLRFRIPESWQEEYSDMDGGMFYADEPDSGTMRVKVITIEATEESGAISVEKILGPLIKHLGKSSDAIQYIGKNALVRYNEPSAENGTKLRINYWVFANPVTSTNARIVTFSYTVLESLAENPTILQELQMLDAEITETEFSLQIGQFG